MKIQPCLDTLRIGGIRELDAVNARALRQIVIDALTDTVTNIEIDLSLTVFVDSCGLGALIAFRNTVEGRGGVVRVLNPTAPVQRILELTRLHRVLEIVKCEEVGATVGAGRGREDFDWLPRCHDSLARSHAVAAPRFFGAHTMGSRPGKSKREETCAAHNSVLR